MKKQEIENIYAIVLAPMTGTAVALSEVPDPVFADKVLGDGTCDYSGEWKIVSPVDGEITTIAETGHAYGFTADNGMEVLVHVGLETVSLKGDCFQIHAKAGDKVKAGDLIAEADLEKIKEAGLNCITPVLICSDLEEKELVCAKGQVKAGEIEVLTVKEAKEDQTVEASKENATKQMRTSEANTSADGKANLEKHQLLRKLKRRNSISTLISFRNSVKF